MCKFTILLSGVMLASSAAAALAPTNAPLGRSVEKPMPFKAVPQKLVAPTGDEEIVYEQPEGKVSYYSRTCYGLSEIYGIVYTVIDEGGVVTVVEGEDGSVWMNNVTSQMLIPGWVKAEKNGNELTITGPQKVYEEYDWDTDELNSYYISAVKSEIFTDEDGVAMMRYVPTEDGVFSYTINPETGTIKESGDGSLILGIVAYNEDKDYYFFVGYGDQYIVNSVNRSEPVTLPETAVIQPDWAMYYYTTDYYGDQIPNAQFVDVATDGDDYYVRGIYDVLPDAWVKGTKQGNEIVFPNGQYLGMDMVNLRFAYLAAGELMIDPDTEEETAVLNEEGLPFSIEKDGSLYAQSNVFFIPLATTNPENANFIKYIEGVELKFQDPSTFTNPADPFSVQIENWYPDVALGCYMPNQDCNGNLMNVDNLYYSIYVNQELYTFEPDDFGFEEPLTEVPYLYYNNYSIFVSDTWHAVYVYPTEKNPFNYNPGKEDNTLYNLAVQMIYYPEGKDENPENVLKSYAILVGDDLPPSVGVESLFDGKQVKSEEYLDLQGRVIAAPVASGIYLKRVTYTDGTSATRKVAVK